MYRLIKEGKARVYVPEESAAKISKEMPVFYNPAMKLNRDISVLLLNTIDKKNMQIGLPLAGTGVRGVRFMLELGKGKIKNICINDLSEDAVKLIKRNISLNKVNEKKISVTKKDANMFLLESYGFDYIDIDPFGSPAPFLDSACKRLARGGILAVTATDTGTLCGTFPEACRRKYWAEPLRTEIMHEFGLRILIRKAQLVGAQYEKALIPVFSYSKEHYMRAFFICEKGREKADKVLAQHGMLLGKGPIWLGKLWDYKLAAKMAGKNNENENQEFLDVIKEESRISSVGFYDTHALCRKYRMKKIPRIDDVISALRKKGFKASRTHFNPEGVRSDANEEAVVRVMKRF